MLRLAGTLAFLAWSFDGGPQPDEIAEHDIAAAVRLWGDYFWPHARAALRQVGLSERHATARRVLRWVLAKHLREIAIRDIRRDALGREYGLPEAPHMAPSAERDGRQHRGRGLLRGRRCVDICSRRTRKTSARHELFRGLLQSLPNRPNSPPCKNADPFIGRGDDLDQLRP